MGYRHAEPNWTVQLLRQGATAPVFEILGEENLHQWIAVIDNEENLLELLKVRKPDLKPIDIASQIIPIQGHHPGIKNKVKAHVHTGVDKRPMLPGSSIKGAIRSILLAHLINQQPSAVDQIEMLGFIRKGSFQFNDSQIRARFFGKSKADDPPGNMRHDPNKDWLRFLRPSDVIFSNTRIYQSLVVNKHFNKWSVKDRSFWECIPEDSRANGSLQIPEDLMNEIEKKKYININQKLLTLGNLFNLINKHTKELLKIERDILYDEYHPEAFDIYDDELKRVIDQIDNCDAQSCILRIGAGSGWDFMTGAWLRNPDAITEENWFNLKRSLRWKRYPDHLMFPKSRKLLAGGVPLGLVKISM